MLTTYYTRSLAAQHQDDLVARASTRRLAKDASGGNGRKAEPARAAMKRWWRPAAPWGHRRVSPT